MAVPHAAAYEHFEHRHRFAAWAAARAAQRGLKGGTNELLIGVMNVSAVTTFVRDRATELIGPAAYDELHDGWAAAIQGGLTAKGVDASYGRTAKLIGIYVKAMAVVGPLASSSLATVAHPPIDRILLQSIARCRDRELSAADRRVLRGTSWTTMDRSAYHRTITILRSLLADGAPFWSLEQHWDGRVGD